MKEPIRIETEEQLIEHFGKAPTSNDGSWYVAYQWLQTGRSEPDEET